MFGYLVPNSIGYLEDDKPRMVKTPWSDQDIPFEIGLEKLVLKKLLKSILLLVF